MDPLDFQKQFNPHLYESNNIPVPTDRLFTFSGHTAGLMTAPSDYGFGSSSSPSRLHNDSTHMPMPQPSKLRSQPMTMPSNNYMASASDPTSRYSGMYASTGFDMLSILSRVVNRPNPQINLGPVDLSCAFTIVDARLYDFPVVYVSPMFQTLTGYEPREVMGRNCRFLQAPDGHVAMGSTRRYTDNATVYHIKMHLTHGKESQSSIINYRKSGQPFVNLLTVIPILSDTDEIDYFVGMQVDLVEQPNAIIRSMKDGTYTVNYRHTAIPPSMPSSGVESEHIVEWNNPEIANPGTPKPEPDVMDIEHILNEIRAGNDKYRRLWDEMLLDHNPEFVHILSIKGVFSYCSKATKQMLEYEPDELVGQSLRTVCHPSDITTVLRELKQASSKTDEVIHLIYRIRKKNTGYIWLECQGKVRNEDGRGRKYIVLTGRERPVYQLSQHALTLGRKILETSRASDRVGDGRDDHTFWCKLSPDGLILFATTTCANIIGYTPDNIVKTSLYEHVKQNRTTNLTRALAEVLEGKIVNLQHSLINANGDEIQVASTFYPDGIHMERPSFVLMHVAMADEKAVSDDESVFISVEPDLKRKGRADKTDESREAGGARVIEELCLQHETNWEFEMHQLRINNKKLRDELDDTLRRYSKTGQGSSEVYCRQCLRRLPGATLCMGEDAKLQRLLCTTCSYQQYQK